MITKARRGYHFKPGKHDYNGKFTKSWQQRLPSLGNHADRQTNGRYILIASHRSQCRLGIHTSGLMCEAHFSHVCFV
jgi:hypothetical protein